jgi:hypothetical protein
MKRAFRVTLFALLAGSLLATAEVSYAAVGSGTGPRGSATIDRISTEPLSGMHGSPLVFRHTSGSSSSLASERSHG